METGRINRQIIDYIESMEKKAKQMKFVKDLKKKKLKLASMVHKSTL